MTEVKVKKPATRSSRKSLPSRLRSKAEGNDPAKQHRRRPRLHPREAGRRSYRERRTDDYRMERNRRLSDRRARGRPLH